MSLDRRPSYEAILDSLPDAVLMIAEGLIVWGNAAARKLLRRDPLTDLPLREVLVEGEDEHLGRLARFWTQGLGLEGAHRILFREGEGDDPIPTEVRLASAPSVPGGTYILSVRDARHPARVERFLGELAANTGEWDASLDLDKLVALSEPVLHALGWTLLIFEDTPAGALTTQVSSPLPRELPIWTFLDGLLQAGPLSPEQVPLVTQLLHSGEARFLDDFPHRLSQYGGMGAPFEKVAEEAGMAYAAWVPLRADGEPDRLVIVVAPDLTEYDFLVVRLFAAQLANTIRIGRLSRELVHRERLAAVGEMSAVLAHEVRNPLGVIFNVAGGLRRQLGGQPGLLRLVDILSEESERLKCLVSDLLDFSRPRTPELQRVDVLEVFEEAVAEVEANAELAGTRRTLVRNFPAGGLEGTFDRVMLRRALTNLVLNAFQHTEEEGQVFLSASHQSGRICLAIENDGPPIDEEQRSKIFQPFFTTRPRGTGLGLAVARRVAEDLRGELVLESSEPVRFGLHLPTDPD